VKLRVFQELESYKPLSRDLRRMLVRSMTQAITHSKNRKIRRKNLLLLICGEKEVDQCCIIHKSTNNLMEQKSTVGVVKLPNIDEQWLRPQTLVHNRENFTKVIGQKTKFSRVKNSSLPAVEAPHPG
jgi:hypothetical protein